MVKAFENLEVWFITGAQLLYGGDAVVQVDGHSKIMVEGLNNSGRLPIKVVYKGTANSSKEVADLFAAANNEKEMCRSNNMDAHFLSGKNVDTRITDSAQAPTPSAHTIQRGNSMGLNRHGLHEPEPKRTRRP